MIFEDATQLKDQIRAYAAAHGYSIWFKKNDKRRIQAKYRDCPWELWASFEGIDRTLKIKSYQSNHKCSMNLKPKTTNSKWLAKVLGADIRLSPLTNLVDLQTMAKEKVGVEVSVKLCRKAKRRALDAVKLSMVEHYSKLWNYVYELGRSNPCSTIVLKATDAELVGPPQFRRFYICFHAVKKGFVEGCRKFVGVDGCFLKKWIKGELLVAIGRDADNQMYPIAWEVVEKEDQHTWGWFLNLLDRDIGIGDGEGWTIMSDQQKGLECAVKNLFPQIYHRNCARHIYANFRKRGFTGVNFRKYFWEAAKSTTVEYFRKNMESEDAYNHLMDREPSRWCKAYFPIDSTCDNVDNNICESFNFWILQARYKPLISMLEAIRVQMMVRMRKRKDYMVKLLVEGKKYGKRIHDKLQDSIAKSRECRAVWNGDLEFEIGGSRGGTTVDLKNRTCSCRGWQLCGVPCCHAVSAITLMREEPGDYISECLKGERYLICYGTMLKPLNGMAMWPQSQKQVLLPPPPRIVKGRPKWNRRKDALEDDKKGKNLEEPVVEEDDQFKKGKSSRKGMKMTCRICKKEGHNIRKCPEKPRDEAQQLKKRNAAADNSTSKERNGPQNVLHPSFTKRGNAFITNEALQKQSKSKKRDKE